MINKTKYKKGEWENYRSIAKTFGITIPALKKNFREEGLLDGNRLSEKALGKAIGIKEPITSRFGTGERILWKVTEINLLLFKRNLQQLTNEETYLWAENFSQITQTIGYLGRSMLGFLELSAEDERQGYPEWCREKFGNEQGGLIDETVRSLQEAIYESHSYLRAADQIEFVELLEQNFKFGFSLAEIYADNEYKKMRLMFFKRLYQFIGEWATDKRINQYKRQPHKKTVTKREKSSVNSCPN